MAERANCGRCPTILGCPGRCMKETQPDDQTLPLFQGEASPLARARMLFWVCPDGRRDLVTWDKTVQPAVATCGTCGKTSAEPACCDIAEHWRQVWAGVEAKMVASGCDPAAGGVLIVPRKGFVVNKAPPWVMRTDNQELKEMRMFPRLPSPEGPSP